MFVTQPGTHLVETVIEFQIFRRSEPPPALLMVFHSFRVQLEND